MILEGNWLGFNLANYVPIILIIFFCIGAIIAAWVFSDHDEGMKI